MRQLRADRNHLLDELCEPRICHILFVLSRQLSYLRFHHLRLQVIILVQHTAVLEPVVPFIFEARAPGGSAVPHLNFENRTTPALGPLVVVG